MASNRQIVNPYSIVAFFGFDINTAKAFYERCLSWFYEHDIRPDRGSVTGNGSPGRMLRFNTMRRRLRKDGYGRVQRLRLIATNSVVSVGWLGDRRQAWLEASAAIADLKSLSMLRLAMDLGRILMPAYGMGFRRDVEDEPTLYALGIGDERRLIAWKSYTPGAFRRGVIRELCPVNFLNDSHLQRQINRCTFDEWVRQGLGRGELQRLGSDAWMWTIPESSLPSLNAALERSGLVFNRWQYGG